ncbi:MAG: hypothetical protein HN736_19195 [Anaerolineae bacterium]|nr:hypothetical protein [Anaerolineae bacterium]MBT4311198.1 hypothetical protein [Anaerolineae bacterium]MBT4458160.1 hypothetical protein [Anaerolineae bacterium]MBT6061810.1 hypothetical protein [Anaerolineae bacterium]MBT6323579.1 hypothetical protein [Anaerolineae bacterium]
MADVQMIFGILLLLGIAFPGMLTAYWLLFPATVERAQARLDASPWKSFWLGVLVLFIITIPAGILLSAGGGVGQFLGWLLVAATLTVSGIGAAGIAAKMGVLLAKRSDEISPASAFVRGAIALELAAVFPLVGWFIVIPLAIVASLGATAFALLSKKTIEAKAPVFKKCN